MDLHSRLFIFSATEKNKKFTNGIHPKHFRVSGIKSTNVVTLRNFPNLVADTVALTETANKFQSVFAGILSPM